VGVVDTAATVVVVVVGKKGGGGGDKQIKCRCVSVCTGVSVC